jgi:hypothetical protein
MGREGCGHRCGALAFWPTGAGCPWLGLQAGHVSAQLVRFDVESIRARAREPGKTSCPAPDFASGALA